MNENLTTTELLYSRLGDDPDLGEIVQLFVKEMPARAASLLDQLSACDWEGLRRVAHQLKGAVGSYGFDQITPCAAHLEEQILRGEPEERIREAVASLVDLCKRARAGSPQ